MRVLSLDLENIGPFDAAHVEFLAEAPAVTFITGENGTGKSIVLDAIRGLFGEEYAALERTIWRPDAPFQMSMRVAADELHQHEISTRSSFGAREFTFSVTPEALSHLPEQVRSGPQRACPNWIVDFWRSDLAHDSYDIKSLASPSARRFLIGALQGSSRNAAATEWISFYDYLRDSSDPKEHAAGEILFATACKIVKASLLDGELSHVRRSTFTPIIRQSGQLVPLRNLSSGNAYLIQRLLGLLGKMYAVHTLRETPPETLCETPGLLLIDEAENHLHPRWQKRLISDILAVFPNLQIIATTHSPFLLASVAGARVLVCRYDAERSTCVIDDASDRYASKPFDEILGCLRSHCAVQRRDQRAPGRAQGGGRARR